MRNYEQETAPLQVDVFTALDLDRTILNSTKFFEAYIMPAVRTYYQRRDSGNVGGLMESIRRLEADARGKAFDFIAMLNETAPSFNLSPLNISVLAQQLYEQHWGNEQQQQAFVDDIFADGALDLIDALEEEPGSAWAFYTTGGVQTQTLKMQIVGAILREKRGIENVHAQIIASEHKAHDIALWYDEATGNFAIPHELTTTVMAARQVRLIDDKAVNLQVDNVVSSAGNSMELILAKRAETPDAGGESLAEIAHRIRNNTKVEA